MVGNYPTFFLLERLQTRQAVAHGALTMKKRMRTVFGTQATRRIKWHQPRQFLRDGILHTNVFIYIEVTGGAVPYRLAYAGAQVGIDQKGKAVLPGSIFVSGNQDRIYACAFAVRAGTIHETANAVVAALNERDANPVSYPWYPAAGIQRGTTETIEDKA